MIYLDVSFQIVSCVMMTAKEVHTQEGVASTKDNVLSAEKMV